MDFVQYKDCFLRHPHAVILEAFWLDSSILSPASFAILENGLVVVQDGAVSWKDSLHSHIGMGSTAF